MRVPVPERFALKPVALFIMALFTCQMLTGTSLAFSFLTSLYIAIFAFGFNVGGGLLCVPGAYIFFNGLRSAIIGLTFKVFLLQPGEEFLSVPIKLMECYCAGMAVMAAVAYLARRIVPRKPLLRRVVDPAAMKWSAIGCLIFGAALEVAFFHSADGSLGSAVRQINHFVQVSIILATWYEIDKSGGQRSTNWIVWAGGLWEFSAGAISFGKEGMFIAPTIWFITCVTRNYNFRWKQMAVIALGAWVSSYYLVPYSQYVRSYRSQSRADDSRTAIQYLSHLDETRQLYLDALDQRDNSVDPHLYGKPAGLFDRMNMLAVDDPLVRLTDDGSMFGALPTLNGYASIVPHFIWKSKPSFNYGNEYAHQIGLLAEDDDTTGISFSPTADAYHQEGWFGIFAILPIVLFLYFLVTEALVGSVRDAPWALLPIALLSHVAPEGLTGGTIYLTTYGAFSLVVIYLFSSYVVPAVTGVFGVSGQDRFKLRDFRPSLRGRGRLTAHPAPRTNSASGTSI